MASQDVTELIYKPVPHIYHRYPAEEDLYALFRAGATLTARLVSSAIDLTRPLGFRERGRRNLAAAQRAGVTVAESDRWPDYWAILTALLHDRYGVAPVHTLDEITRLHSLLSGHISLWAAFAPHGEMLAGTVIYKSPEVWHAQYIAASPAGKECGALAAVFRAVHDVAAAAGVRWFDFGTSCERGGHYLNAGLAGQKASFGARAVVYDTYRVAIGV